MHVLHIRKIIAMLFQPVLYWTDYEKFQKCQEQKQKCQLS